MIIQTKIKFIKKDGDKFHINCCVKLNDGRKCNGIRAVNVDISERNQSRYKYATDTLKYLLKYLLLHL